MLKRVMLLAVTAIISLLLLSACGPSSGDTPTAANAPTSGAAATTTTSGAAAATTTTSAGGTTAAAASGGSGSVATSGDIKIGLMGPFTGASAPFGTAIKRGAEMAVADVNNAGGINGRKVTLVERDDQYAGSTTLGQQNITDLISKENVLALFGTANTAVGVAQAPYVNQGKTPWVIPVTTGTAITQDKTATPNYIFRDSMVDSEQGPFAAEYAIKAGYKKIALMSDSSAYGKGGHADVLKALTKLGITPVSDETYDLGFTEDQMKPILSRIKSTGADIIINWGLGPEAGNIRKAQSDVNFTIPMIGSWGLATPSFVKLAGNALANGVEVPEDFLQDTPPTQKGSDFVVRYKKTYNTDILDFPSGLAQSYDAMGMLLTAMKQPGADSDRSKLRDALENLASFDGIIKTYTNPWKVTDTNPYHEALTRQDFVMAVWKDGKLVKVGS